MLSGPEQDRYTLGDGTMLTIHAKRFCLEPCAFHAPLPGPWEDWPLAYNPTASSRGDAITLRVCRHGVRHPAVEQFVFWARNGQEYLATHNCCGCPCAPDGVIPEEMRPRIPAEYLATMTPAFVPKQILDIVAPPKDEIIDLTKFKVPGARSWGGKDTVPRSVVEDAAKNSIKELRIVAQEVLDKHDALLGRLADTPAPDPQAPIAYPSPEKNPNKVAAAYLQRMYSKNPIAISGILKLLLECHKILAIEEETNNNYKWVVECDAGCGDYFNAANVETDDNRCPTLKMAILGGYGPVQWHVEDDDEDD